MSTLIDLAIFPVDKVGGVSPYVSRAVRVIRDSGLSYKLGPMGTSIEGEWEEVMAVLNRCFYELAEDCERVYLVFKADYRKGATGRITGKVKSVEEKL